MVARSARMAGKKCSCNLGWMAVTWVLMAFGLWALVGGFATQFTSASPLSLNLTVLVLYLAGLVVITFGKMAKWKACSECTVHRM